MKTSTASPSILANPMLCVLALLASAACTTNGGSASSPGGSGGSGTGAGEEPASGGGSRVSAASHGTATDGATSSGGTGSKRSTGTAGASSKGSATQDGGAGGEDEGGSSGKGNGGTRTTGSGVGGAAAGGTEGRSDVTSNLGGTAAGGAGTQTSTLVDSVARTTSSFKFQHFPVETGSDGVWNGGTTPGKQATSTTYETTILENGYLRVTLLPSYGGRILSIVHKPTNREFLYQNPIGTPYLMQQDIFYYDYLVIMGGIFPSFPEPEHGKYWNQPYDLKVVSESKEAITVRMSRKDDLNVAAGVPTKYDVGRTDVLVELDVTLRAGSTSLELGTKLTNTQNKAISKFEYWTNTTLAPGSTPGATAIPLNTRILAAMDKVHLMESSWSWFANAEERISGEIFKWNNLSYFKNWADQGIGYASPEYHANWSGLVNYDNSMGILRVSDNAKTPGLKLWTFGKGSLTTDINDSTQWLRPTIEMWHGITPEFWTRGSLAANEVRQWSDNYFPTFGLKEVTAASKYGAMYLSSSKSGTDTELSVAATLTLPDQTVKAILRLDGTSVAEKNVVVSADEATTVSASVASSKVAAGAVFEVEFLREDVSILSGKLTLE